MVYAEENLIIIIVYKHTVWNLDIQKHASIITTAGLKILIAFATGNYTVSSDYGKHFPVMGNRNGLLHYGREQHMRNFKAQYEYKESFVEEVVSSDQDYEIQIQRVLC